MGMEDEMIRGGNNRNWVSLPFTMLLVLCVLCILMSLYACCTRAVEHV